MTQKAKRAAQKILKNFGRSIPVDVKTIIENLNITVRVQPMEDAMSGMLVVKEGRAVIGVNQSHHPNRQRFSLAHELGHFILHSRQTPVFVDASTIFFRDELAAEGNDLVEIEANTFAAELLMPEDTLRRLIRQHPLDAFDDKAVQRLASLFGVSVQALTIRLAKLGLISA